MNYEVTATRRRPQDFSSMLGQEFVASALSNSIQQGRIAHAYLFCGPRGVGKTSSARILARSLNCEQGPTIHPCNTCANCQEIAQGHSLDVIEIDGASNTGVGDVREIKDEVLFQPNNSRYKIYIIDEVHMLSMSAFNALLKTIEEPPEYVIFIFATTEIHKVPATIKSRCQQYNFRLIGLDTIKDALYQAAQELHVQTEDDALFWLAKESGGSMRDAYTLFDQAIAFADGKLTLSKIKEKMGLMGLDELNELMKYCYQANLLQVLTFVDDMIAKGIAIEQILTDIAEYWRNLLFLKSGIDRESIIGYPVVSFANELVEGYTVHQMETALAWVFQLYRDIRYSIHPRFELELLLSKLCQLKDWIDPQALVRHIQKMRKEIMAHPADTLPDVVAPVPIAAPAKVVEPSVWTGSSDDLKQALIQHIKKDKVSLATVLQKCDIHYHDNTVQLTANHSYEQQTLKQEQHYIHDSIKDIIKKELLLHIVAKADDKPVVQQHKEQIPDQDIVEFICETFEGEVIA